MYDGLNKKRCMATERSFFVKEWHARRRLSLQQVIEFMLKRSQLLSVNLYSWKTFIAECYDFRL